MILVAPVGLIFWRAFEHGLHPFWAAISNPDAVHALKLTLEITLVAVPLNTVFGILCGLAIVRHRIPGMGFVNAIVDLPMALSPVVVGLALYLLYARDGWFGGWLFGHHVMILFAYPGILLATIFVSLPFVVREVVPVLREIGTEQEEAAATLGSSAFTTFRRITLPAIRWAVAYGVVLTTARSLGEFGAVAIVSGGHRGTDADVDAVRAGVVREQRQQHRRVRGSRAARGARDPDARRDDDDPTERGDPWRSKHVTSRSASATSSRSTTSRSRWRAAR